MPRSLCWKDEYTEYMHEICPGRLTPEVTRLLNEKFGTNYTKTQIGGVRKRLGLQVGNVFKNKLLNKEQHDYFSNNQQDSGLTGRFEKGQIPFNKGKKFPDRPRNSGQFKKGNKPPNYLPVGTINFTTDGYPKEKIADPNKWVLKHRKVWEDNFGPIPEGYSVCFLDGDKTNYDISNLILLSNEELARMNQNNYFSTDPELTKLGVGITKLSRKIKQQE